MSENIRFSVGGFSPRFLVRRTDGKACRPDARYMVMDGSGADPHAVKAILAYAESVQVDNPEMAADLREMIENGWPARLGQHEEAA